MAHCNAQIKLGFRFDKYETYRDLDDDAKEVVKKCCRDKVAEMFLGTHNAVAGPSSKPISPSPGSPSGSRRHRNPPGRGGSGLRLASGAPTYRSRIWDHNATPSQASTKRVWSNHLTWLLSRSLATKPRMSSVRTCRN